MKKIVSLLLILSILTVMFAGCGKTTEPEAAPPADQSQTTETPNATTDSENETTGDNLWTIDVLVDTTLGEKSIDTTIGKYLADEFGIAFNFSTYSGDLVEKQALMLAGGDYNEIQYMQGQTMVQQYIDAGA